MKDNAFPNVNILASDSKYNNLIYASTSPELLRIDTFDYFRKQVFFHVTEVCGCSGTNKKIITILFYFNIKEKSSIIQKTLRYIIS